MKITEVELVRYEQKDAEREKKGYFILEYDSKSTITKIRSSSSPKSVVRDR